MIPRMTTVGTLKNYRYDLNRSNNTLAKAMQTVTTQRNFNSYAENPALTVRCFQIRRSYLRAESQYTVNESLRHKYDVGWEALGNVSTDLYALADDTAFGSVIRALSDPTGPGRTALGQSLCAKAQDMAQTMNCRYGENYVFAGADTLNAPFTWGPQINLGYIEELDPSTYEDPTKVPDPDPTNPAHAPAFQYLIDPDKVNTVPDTDPAYNNAKEPMGTLYTDDETKAKQVQVGEEPDPNDPDKTIPLMGPAKNPKYDKGENYKNKYVRADVQPGDVVTTTDSKAAAAQSLYYRRVPTEFVSGGDKEKLDYFTDSEAKYIDVGLGHKEEDDKALASTVFDCSLQGIDFLGGYGTKTVTLEREDGSKVEVDNIPKNIISVVNEMGLILQRCSREDGRWASGEDQLRFEALTKEFENGTSAFRERWTEMDTQCGFLRDNSELLENTSDSLLQQYMELEAADPAAAISEYMFARYCFDAALKVGNSILSQSLMDYMSF